MASPGATAPSLGYHSHQSPVTILPGLRLVKAFLLWGGPGCLTIPCWLVSPAHTFVNNPFIKSYLYWLFEYTLCFLLEYWLIQSLSLFRFFRSCLYFLLVISSESLPNSFHAQCPVPSSRPSTIPFNNM